MAKKKAAKPTFVSFLLDETGSMNSIKDDTIGGFNSYVKTLRDKAEGIIKFSLIKFDSNKIEKVYIGKDIHDVPDLNEDTYQPGAMTPLIDACVKTIHATESKLKDLKRKYNVLCVFQTDGFENASHEYSQSDLAALIKKKEKQGWVFVFLGAGIDSYAQSRKMGISTANTVSYGKEKSEEVFAMTAANSVAYANTGMRGTASYSSEQKMDAGDLFDPTLNNITDNQITDPHKMKNAAGSKTAKRSKKKKVSVVDNFTL